MQARGPDGQTAVPPGSDPVLSSGPIAAMVLLHTVRGTRHSVTPPCRRDTAGPTWALNRPEYLTASANNRATLLNLLIKKSKTADQCYTKRRIRGENDDDHRSGGQGILSLQTKLQKHWILHFPSCTVNSIFHSTPPPPPKWHHQVLLLTGRLNLCPFKRCVQIPFMQHNNVFNQLLQEHPDGFIQKR